MVPSASTESCASARVKAVSPVVPAVGLGCELADEVSLIDEGGRSHLVIGQLGLARAEGCRAEELLATFEKKGSAFHHP